MAFIQVSMLEGRTALQKRALTKAINDAMVEHAAVNPELLHIVITRSTRTASGRAPGC